MNAQFLTMNRTGQHPSIHSLVVMVQKQRCSLLIGLLLLLWGASARAQEMYYVPQVANGLFGAGSFRTTFVLFNPNALSADVTIYLADASGNPLTVRIPSMGRDFSFSLRLPPGAARILQTDGSGSLATGSATITCSGAISVSAVFSLYDTEGRFITEAGVGNSPPGTDFSIPVDTTGSFNTGAALFNLNDTDVSVSLKLLNTAGDEVAQTQVDLGGWGQTARFVSGAGQLFPDISNFRGTLVISSPTEIAAVALRQNDSPLSYTSLPAVPSESAATTHYLPQVADGSFGSGSYRTAFLIFNPTPSPATVDLALTAGDGSPFSVTFPGRGNGSSFRIDLGPAESVYLQTEGTGALAAGAARIISNVPVGASAIFTVLDAEGRFQTETGVGSSAAMSELSLPVDITGGFDTGVAFFNPGADDIQMTLRLLDLNGVLVATSQPLPLEAGHQSAQFVSQIFPQAANFQGSLSITISGGAVAALTLRQNSPPLSYTTLPVAQGSNPGRGPLPPLLAKKRTLSAISNVVVNETLQEGFRLSGIINGSGRIESVFAQIAGSAFAGSVNPATRRYLVIVPPGSYGLMACFGPVGITGQQLVTTFASPGNVAVSADTTRDATIAAVALLNVSGAITGLDSLPSATGVSLVFTSGDGRTESRISVDALGSYQGQLPPGNYAASLEATVAPDSDQLETLQIYNLGIVTIGAAAVTANFALPAFYSLSGTVAIPGYSNPLSDGTSVVATDNAAPQFPSTACATPPSDGWVDIGDNGSYLLTLAGNRVYQPWLSMPLMQEQREIGWVFYPMNGGLIQLTGSLIHNLNLPALPALVTISGRITDGAGRGISDVDVLASTEQVAGAFNVGFQAETTTDANGYYSFQVFRSASYELTFQPLPPLPSSGRP